MRRCVHSMRAPSGDWQLIGAPAGCGEDEGEREGVVAGETGGRGEGGAGGAGGGDGAGGAGGEGPCLGFPDDATASPSSPSHGGAHRSYEYMYGGEHMHARTSPRVVGTKRWLTVWLIVLYLRP